MTLPSGYTPNFQTADGIDTVFTYTFKIFEETDLEVLETTAAGVETTATGYTVSGVGNDAGGSITYSVAPASGTKITLRSNRLAKAEVDLPSTGPFQDADVEEGFDIVTRLVQQSEEAIGRSLKVPKSSVITDATITGGAANYLIRFNSAFDAIEAVSAVDAALGNTFTPTLNNFLVGDGTDWQVTTPAASRTALGLGSLSLQASSSISVTGGTISGLTSLGVSGNITVTGTVDGVDVAALKTDVDGFPDALKNLTTAEIGELENIGSSTISATQWGYLGATDQGLATTDSPTFTNGDFSGTEALKVPVGTTAQRPGTPVDGDLRINTTLGNLEVYRNTAWRSLESGGGTMSNLVEDTTPQLGGNLDVNGNSIVSVSAGNISITPDTTGDLILDGLKWPQADGSANQTIKTDGAGQLSWTTPAGGGLTDVVDDLTPQLGGDLDLNGNQIMSPDGTDLIDIPNGSIDLQTASASRLDITDAGVRLGAANARVTTVLDEDTMSSNSATALATQQSIKAYVDAAGGGGSFDLISTSTASTSSSIDFTGLSSTYSQYLIVFYDVIFTTDNRRMELRYSTDNGSTFISSSTYSFASYGSADDSATNRGSRSAAFSTIVITSDTVNYRCGNGVGDVVSGNIYIISPSTSLPTMSSFNVHYRSSTDITMHIAGVASNTTTTAVDAVQLIPEGGGTFASGVFKLYGMKGT